MFNSFRQNLYKFFCKEDKEASIKTQPYKNKKVLEIMKRFGSTIKSKKSVEFFFYTDEENKASNLAIELKKMGYEIYDIGSPHPGRTKWSVSGQTGDLNFDEETLSKWSQQMIELGYECDCEFDGWGTLI